MVEKSEDVSLKVLVVDDVVANRCILTRTMENIVQGIDMKCSITESHNGKDAFDTFCSRKGDFDVVFLDIVTPVIDGFTTTMLLHDECGRIGIQKVPVVAVTSSVSSFIDKKCMSAGMTSVVHKPYSEDELFGCVKCILDNYS